MTLRPSSSHIWTQCLAYPAMAANVPPEPESDASREGTCAAWVAECVLSGEYPDARSMIDVSHENGWLVEADMAYHIQKYVDMLRSYGGRIEPERTVTLNDQIAGTPDAHAVLTGDWLRVDDLKYGYLPVEAYRNTQVSIYAGAIIRAYASAGVTIRRVTIGIYQPRATHALGIYRTWGPSVQELMQYVAWIEDRGRATNDPNAVCTTGAHCLYCEAGATCATFARAAYNVYEVTGRETQRHLNATELSEELTFLEKAEAVIKGRKRAIEAEAAARIERAEHIPGWHMQQGYGHRRWTQTPDVIKAFTGIDPVAKTVTPAELEKRGADPAVVATLTETPRTKPTLKRIPEGFYANLFKMKDSTQ